MKLTTLFLAIFATLLISFPSLNAQTWNFAKRFSSQAGGYIENTSVALAPDGSTYVTGNFSGTVHFDTVTISRPANAADNFGFVLKLDAALNPLWAQIFPHRTYDVTTDAQGNVFVAGSSLASHNDSLAYVAKYAPDGMLLDTFSAKGTADSWARLVRTDAAGNCYLAGERFSAGVANFGPFTPTPSGGRDCFLIKLSPDLSQVMWATYTGASSNLDNIYDLEVDKNGFVYTSGNYSQNYSIGCFCYNGSFYTEKHNAATGSSVWKKIFTSGSGDDTKQLLSLDSSGQSVYVSASFKHTTTFQSGLSLTAAANTDYHLYVAKMDAANGNVQWAEKVALTGDNYVTRMARQGLGLYLNGFYYSPVLFGDTLLNQQGVDAFLAKTNASNGTVLSAERFSGPGGEYGYGLDTRDSMLVISGKSSSSILTIGNFNLPGSANSIYIARSGPLPAAPLASFTADTTIGCAPLTVQFNSSNSTGNPGSFNWQFPGGMPASSTDPNPVVVYSSPGTYAVTLTVGNAGGQNTASQNNFITVNPAPIPAFSSSINGFDVTFTNTSTNASSYLWDFGDGQTSTQTNPVHTYVDCGTYTVILTSSNACGTTSSTASVTVGDGVPDPGFTSTVNGMLASFTNTSTNGSSYLWDFGDGQSSTQTNPVHPYVDCGTYTVILTSSNACGTASSTASVTVGDGVPDPGFTSTVNGLLASFTNTSTNGSSYLWDFGDGQSSTQTNPVHSYVDCGTYTVILTSSNTCGTASSTASVTVGDGVPDPGFTSTVNGLLASFTNTSTNSGSYAWDFGDGQSSTQTNPVHTYMDCGTYTVILTSSNACGTAISTGTVTVGNGLPSVAFTSTVNGPAVSFTNNSTNANVYLWDFGDGISSAETNPVHVYIDCGTYTVTLTCSNTCGTASSTASVTIGNGLPLVSFSSSVNDFTVTFTNTTVNGNAYIWDFGDGQVSGEQNPVHTYADCGTYTVILSGLNNCGTAQSTDSVTILVASTAMFTTTVNGLQVSFLNTSTGGTTYFWDFGDGETSALQDPPAHVYADSGTYVITLVVTNNCGAAIFQQSVTVTTVGTHVAEWLERFQLFPNPNRGVFSLEAKADWQGEIDIAILNSLGQVVYTETIVSPEASLKRQFDLQNEPAGVYWISIRTGIKSWQQNFVIAR